MTQAKRAPRLTAQDVTSDFDALRISIAPPEQIRSWSFGEVKRPETINYRTFKPEKDGLFCMRIFGPVKDYECGCGKYKRIKFKGIVCEKCGVEVTLSKVRRERMGHIELASPVAHIWFTKSLPSRIGTLLELSTKELDRILYYESYIVVDPGLTSLQERQILSEEEFVDAQDTYGEGQFEAVTGALALKKLLSQIDLKKQKEELTEELKDLTSEVRRKKVVKRLKLVSAFLASNTRPEWMVLDVVPVIPPELRPLVPLDGGRFATADLNDLYRRLINRNNRLKRLYELKAPQIIIRNEERMLQEVADALFDNSRRGRPVLGANKRPLKSLSDALKGKQGRFRQNLLGKRVDYSGRSVIVVGPQLKLHQCGLPKKMALELFRPFVYHRLEKYGLAPTLKAAKRFVEKERPEVWGLLEEVVKEHPVMLNRAPTLHRLGIQAFEPLLIEGKAIQLHPLVCKAFNADFDGDTMSVHVPISVEAQVEARVLMMSTNNILSPADGSPVIIPSKDMVLGLYYLTLARETEGDKEPVAFANMHEIEHALFHKKVALHQAVRIRMCDAEGQSHIETTTPGRLLLKQILPTHKELPFSLINKPLTSGDVSQLISLVYRFCGQDTTVTFADQLMTLGFKYSTLSGVSFGKDDLVVPEEKSTFVDDTWKMVKTYRQQYLDGLITQGERANKVTDAWGNCTDKVVGAMLKKLSQKTDPLDMNAIYMMAHSGARGSVAQMRQLAAMRGLIGKHSGEILEYPIISNFSEGLKAFEYFNSTHGSRKGLSDMALKTANSGYLTRRLVDVAQDSIIAAEDCGTSDGIEAAAIIEGGEVLSSLEERIFGRTLAETIKDENDNTLLAAGTLVDEEVLSTIVKLGLKTVRIRSVLACKLEKGICAQCYGLDIARGERVNLGEAVGVIAAQSIGEPGTQLTLRTFHLGGAAQKTAQESSVKAAENGTVSFDETSLVTNSQGQAIFIGRTMEMTLKNKKETLATYELAHGAHILVKNGSTVKKDTKLAEWDPYNTPVVTEKTGFVHFVDLVEGVSFKEVVDEATGIPKRIVLDWRQSHRGSGLRPRLVVRDENNNPVLLANGLEARYFLSVDAQIDVANGAEVVAGDVLAQLPRESSKIRDITGGLPRIAELFEARHPKDPAIISEIDGHIEFGKDYKTKRAILVVPEDKEEPAREYFVPRGKHVLIQEGDKVKKGDFIAGGSPVLQDILRILGVEVLANHLIKEVQEVYRFQGVKISDKHIEIIVRQLMQKVEITNPGDTLFLTGDQIDRQELTRTNQRLLAEKRTPAQAVPVLQGMTKASLQTSSFISAASFQDTTRVLTEAAVKGKIDKLIGLKESVIVGRLISAGTGWMVNNLKKQARTAQQTAVAEETAAPVVEAVPPKADTTPEETTPTEGG
ncbi:MAG: DNA-directed RNA polymerase subunit beta' [Holosporaceae bacterium]